MKPYLNNETKKEHELRLKREEYHRNKSHKKLVVDNEFIRKAF